MKLIAVLLLTAAVALPALDLSTNANLAAYAEAQAKARIGAQLVAENLHRMQ